MIDRTRTLPAPRRVAPAAPAADEGHGSLAEQAHRWAEVARRARERYDAAGDAETELRLRRNPSGQ